MACPRGSFPNSAPKRLRRGRLVRGRVCFVPLTVGSVAVPVRSLSLSPVGASIAAFGLTVCGCRRLVRPSLAWPMILARVQYHTCNCRCPPPPQRGPTSLWLLELAQLVSRSRTGPVRRSGGVPSPASWLGTRPGRASAGGHHPSVPDPIAHHRRWRWRDTWNGVRQGGRPVPETPQLSLKLSRCSSAHPQPSPAGSSCLLVLVPTRGAGDRGRLGARATWGNKWTFGHGGQSLERGVAVTGTASRGWCWGRLARIAHAPSHSPSSKRCNCRCGRRGGPNGRHGLLLENGNLHLLFLGDRRRAGSCLRDPSSTRSSCVLITLYCRGDGASFPPRPREGGG